MTWQHVANRCRSSSPLRRAAVRDVAAVVAAVTTMMTRKRKMTMTTRRMMVMKDALATMVVVAMKVVVVVVPMLSLVVVVAMVQSMNVDSIVDASPVCRHLIAKFESNRTNENSMKYYLDVSCKLKIEVK